MTPWVHPHGCVDHAFHFAIDAMAQGAGRRLHRCNTLAHIGMWCDEYDFAGIDLDPGIEGRFTVGEALRQWIGSRLAR